MPRSLLEWKRSEAFVDDSGKQRSRRYTVYWADGADGEHYRLTPIYRDGQHLGYHLLWCSEPTNLSLWRGTSLRDGMDCAEEDLMEHHPLVALSRTSRDN